MRAINSFWEALNVGRVRSLVDAAVGEKGEGLRASEDEDVGGWGAYSEPLRRLL